jgi:IS5 family transposase
MNKIELTSFADLAADKRKVKEVFFNQINSIIDWEKIDQLIKRHYNKGVSAVGRPSYSGLLLFKITLLQTWYNLSDYEVEDQVNDRISFSKFLGLSLDDNCPDHSVISRFRTEMTKRKVYDKLLKEINKHLEMHGILVKQGILLDASVVDTLRKPKGKTEYEVVIDREEDSQEEQTEEEPQKENRSKLVKKEKPGVDKEARWVKKRGRLHYGYKQHTATNEEGLVLALITTPANESDTKHVEDVLDKIDTESYKSLKADKGYKSENNDKVVKEKKLRNHILHKAKKNKKLTQREIEFNKLISKTRYKVERTFGTIKKQFGGAIARYIGLDKMHTQHMMQAIAYNLYRSPGIIVSCCEKQTIK